jgi:hypothetical protein
MADLMSHALSYSKESIREYFIKPMFVQSDIRDIVTVRTDIKNSEKLDFIDNLDKITKAYAQGTSFTTSTGVTITQKTLQVSDMKAEIAQNGKAFLNYVKEALLAKGVDENDIAKGDGLFEQIAMEIYMAGLARDFQRQIFFGDLVKEDIVSGVADGSLDADYKEYDGFWTRIINAFDDSTIPAAQYLDLNSSTYQSVVAVKQVATATVSGTAGSLILTINGVNYTTANTGTAAGTAAAFVTDHAATIAARFGKLVVTNPSGADVVVTAGIAGSALSVVDASTGGTTASVAATAANVQNTTLKTDAALTAFKALWSKMPASLKGLMQREGRIMVTGSVADNYTDTIEALNGSDAAYFTLRDGEKVKAFRGIPIVERIEWDEHISDDFDGVRPHRILFTIPRNLVVGTDGISDDTKVESWYEILTQNRHMRVEYKAGTQYIHEDYIVAAY